MFDDAALSQIFSATTGVWALVSVVLVALIKAWPAIQDKVNQARLTRASIDDGAYKRMDDRIRRLEIREEECQIQLSDALRRIAAMEGYNAGLGRAHQEAAGVVALDRLEQGAKDE